MQGMVSSIGHCGGGIRGVGVLGFGFMGLEGAGGEVLVLVFLMDG